MKNTLTSLTIAALALFGAQSVLAQMAPDRAEVKKEAAAAAKSGETSKGEAGAPVAKTPKSGKPRADVKKEGAVASKAKDTSKGEKGAVEAKGAAPVAKTDTTRPEVKADAAAANKAGTTSKGEAGTVKK